MSAWTSSLTHADNAANPDQDSDCGWQTPAATSSPDGIALRGAGDAKQILVALEQRATTLKTERDAAERAFQRAQRSVACYRAVCGQMHNAQTPLISRLPVELLIAIFFLVQNTVVTAQVCRYWRLVALSCPRLWSSLHVHPSKGSKHLENLLARSLGHTIDVCFCPVPNMVPRLPASLAQQQSATVASVHPHQQLSLPPIYTQQYHPDMCLTQHVVSILSPHADRLRSFELHATVPGTWLTLLPLITSPAPNLRSLHIYTKLHHDVARVPSFFAGHTPLLRNVQITGGFPLTAQTAPGGGGLLRGLTFLRLEGIPTAYRPTTRMMEDILRACPELVALSLLDAGPVPAPDAENNDDGFGASVQGTEILLPRLRAFSFRDTDIHLTTNTVGSVGMSWFGKHVHAPAIAAFHLMLAPHPLAYVPRERGDIDVDLSSLGVAAGTPSPNIPGGVGAAAAAPGPPYSVLSLVALPPVLQAMRAKTRRIIDAVPSAWAASLKEMYLWAPHATCEEVRSLLKRLPGLKTLEIPMVRDPVETVELFARSDAAGDDAIVHQEEEATPPATQARVPEARSREAPDGYFAVEPTVKVTPALGIRVMPGARLQGSGDHGGTIRITDLLNGEQNVQPMKTAYTKLKTPIAQEAAVTVPAKWLCPELERIGLPHIPALEHARLEQAFMSVLLMREQASAMMGGTNDSNAQQGCVKRISSLLAPSGKPAYICENVWGWIGERAKIQTLLPGGGMDMLFDEISATPLDETHDRKRSPGEDPI